VISSGYRLRRLTKALDGLPAELDLLRHLNRVVRVDDVQINDGKKPRPVTLVMCALLAILALAWGNSSLL